MMEMDRTGEVAELKSRPRARPVARARLYFTLTKSFTIIFKTIITCYRDNNHLSLSAGLYPVTLNDKLS